MKLEVGSLQRTIDRSRIRPASMACVLVGLLLGCVLGAPPALAQIVPGGSTVEGKTIGDWGFEWWQWVWGITSVDPLIDTVGTRQFAGQMPPVFFTCGAAGAAAGVPVTRSFYVPADQYILVALSTIGVWYEPGIDPPDICTNGAPAEVDMTTSLSFSLDGVPISQADLFNNHREPSSLSQTAVVVPGNPYAAPGSYPGSCSDGYFVMIEPLPTGPHVIECGFTHPNGAVLDHTNEINVLGPPILNFVEEQVNGVGGVDGLDGTAGATVSPDGLHVYVAGGYDDAVAVFARDAGSGALTFVEAEFDGVGGVDGLDSAEGLAVSPDGLHVYVTGAIDDAVAVFARDAGSGALTFVEAVFDGVGGVDWLDRAHAVAVSPDGLHVYVTAWFDDAVVAFTRDAGSGALTFVEAKRDGVGGVDGLNGARSVTVSPDGLHVYVTSGEGFDSAVVAFTRDAGSGALTFVEAVFDGDGGVGGVDGLNGARSVAVSPDGLHVYVASEFDDAVAAFTRDAVSGALSFVEEKRNGGVGVGQLNGAHTAAVSPDGAHVYVTGEFFISKVVVFEVIPAVAPSVPAASMGGRILLALGISAFGTLALARRRQRRRLGARTPDGPL
jgi:DNA-binding beta-propeller fold protein YncE